MLIYTMTTAGGAATALHNINNITEGANGTGGNGEDSENLLFQASNGNFYGANFGGGSGNQGGLYELTSKDVFSGFLFLPASNTTHLTSSRSIIIRRGEGTPPYPRAGRR